MVSGFWYGINDVEFIYHGDWADSEVRYNEMLVNAPTVENTMIERYKEHCDEHNIIDDNYDGFEDFMKEYDYEVKELIQMAWEALPRIKTNIEDMKRKYYICPECEEQELRYAIIDLDGTNLEEGYFCESCGETYIGLDHYEVIEMNPNIKGSSNNSLTNKEISNESKM